MSRRRAARKPNPPNKGKAKMNSSLSDLKEESRIAAKEAAKRRAALAKAEKNAMTELVERITKLDPKVDLPKAEVEDLIEWAKGLLG